MFSNSQKTKNENIDYNGYILGNINETIKKIIKKYWKNFKNNRKINNAYIEVVLILTNKLIYIEGYKTNNNICKYFFYLKFYICLVFNYFIK